MSRKIRNTRSVIMNGDTRCPIQIGKDAPISFKDIGCPGRCIVESLEIAVETTNALQRWKCVPDVDFSLEGAFTASLDCAEETQVDRAMWLATTSRV